jgi:two-component system LytT family response regulator
MKILIVDDELLALQRLRRMLSNLGYQEIFEARNSVEVRELLEYERFDVVFLDIHMPQSSGLELAYELRYYQENLAIIFQTAYKEHALKAFDIGAVGYLVKPFSVDQLQTTLQRAFQRVEEVEREEGYRMLSKAGENYYLLKPEEVFYIKADLSEVMIRSSKGFSYYGEKISHLEEKLVGHDFVRIHRSYLININTIKEIETIEQSKLRFYFHGISESIDSSKDGAKAFRNRF